MSGGSRSPGGTLYGPYHRLESPTQTMQVAGQQVLSGEIWGQSTQVSYIPAVRAYRGPLPPNRRGIEFMTGVAPHPNSHPTDVRWLLTTPGVMAKSIGFVAIPVFVTKNTQV
jgi:hypothetical protein